MIFLLLGISHAKKVEPVAQNLFKKQKGSNSGSYS
jgi:hypothetical protein